MYNYEISREEQEKELRLMIFKIAGKKTILRLWDNGLSEEIIQEELGISQHEFFSPNENVINRIQDYLACKPKQHI